ncbi:MAG: glycosyl transferase family protein [Polymorphobacter sp.]
MAEAAALALTIWHLAVHELLIIIAVGVLLSGLDDLFIDAVYFARTFWRQQFVYRRHRRANAETIRRQDPAPIAIIVPAWDEAAVIGAMLSDLVTRLDYPRFRIFVGLYPNDPAGQAAVAAVADNHIQSVICDLPGPTTKADCLNHLWRALVAHEASSGVPFKAIVLHDAEDVIHPQELWIFDALVPRLALVQLPVLPLADAGSRWISGHYLDEFAESHTKDLVVREALGAAVPSAGVATAIDRRLLGQIAAAAGGQPFDADCLTEDYELGLRVKALGGRGALVRLRSGDDRIMVATREHFPASFDAALRQKTRWLIGIGLAGWDRLGWHGGLADRYMLARDRKALMTALLTVAGYGVAGLLLLGSTVHFLLPGLPSPPTYGTGLVTLLWFNTALLIWRLLMRAGFTAHAYGPGEGLRAIPRAVVGNVINAAAALAAARRYRAILSGDARLVWDKTAHRFPGAGSATE